MAVKSSSFGSQHVRPMGRTRGGTDERAQQITPALFHFNRSFALQVKGAIVNIGSMYGQVREALL